MLQSHVATDIVAWRGNMPIDRNQFLHDVYALAQELPDASYALNFCEDRYWFLTGFAAILLKGQTCLLPPNRSIGSLRQIMAAYSESYCLADEDFHSVDMPHFQINPEGFGSSRSDHEIPLIPHDHLAAVVFTSGTTRQPQPHLKYWRDLVTGARMAQQRLGFGSGDDLQSIVATVPPQHMYGLETTVINPLVNGIAVHAGPAFFPADIQSALFDVPEPRILVTTPLHLKSALDAGLDWPSLEFVLSATAPLDPALASRAEQACRCPVLEIYGCTEAGALASRRTAATMTWELFDQSHLVELAGGHGVSGPNLPQAQPLHDVIEPVTERHFLLHGRHSDMVNIAGKRASLEELNTRLRNIEGVSDGAFVMLESDGSETARMLALVVAPTLDSRQIRQTLSDDIDPVFLPRRIYQVAELPRSDTGKLPYSALLKLLNTVRKDDGCA